MEKLEQERHTRTGRTLAILYGLYVMNFGESSDPRVLVELAQEAEQSGWNGFFLTDALMYHADGHEPATDTFVGFSPTPVQRPRVPIWIGGSWPNKPPFRRAARWDGLIPIKHEKTINVEPNDLLEIKAFVAKYRRNTGPLDIAIVGNASSKEQIESRRLEYERQGLITWWLKYLPAYRNSIK